MNDPLFGQDDDISILLGEDDVNGTSPQLIPHFNLTASRHQLPTTSGITSMMALSNAYEELKKKFNDLNLRHQSLLTLCRKKHIYDIPGELSPSGSHSLDEKPSIVQISRRDEIEKLHCAIHRLNHELSEEKSKNKKLKVKIEEMSHNIGEEKNQKSLNILENLKQNIEMLEKSVEIHQAIISKQFPNNKNSEKPLLGKSDIISQRKQQSEHDELSSLGNKSGYSSTETLPLSSTKAADAALATAAAATSTIKTVQNATEVQKSDDGQKGKSIIDLKGNERKQERHKRKPQQFLLPPPHLCTNTLTPSSSSQSAASTTTTTTPFLNTLGKSKDGHLYFNAEAVGLSAKTSEQFVHSPEMICPICEQPFTDLSKFQEHVFDCKYVPVLDRNCPICMNDFTNATQDEFEQHVNAHFDLPANEYEII